VLFRSRAINLSNPWDHRVTVVAMEVNTTLLRGQK
jgi:hypothetical protein